MKIQKILLALVLLASFAGHAEKNESNSVDNSSSEIKQVSAEKLRYRFGITGNVMVFDKDGTGYQGSSGESRSWRFSTTQPIVANWSYSQKGMPSFVIRHTWDFNKNKQLVAKISQYDSVKEFKDGEITLGKLIKEQTYTVENFSDINWVVEQTDQRRVVVKFGFEFWNAQDPINVGPLSISGRDLIIFDNKNNLWASKLDNTNGDSNIYFGATTHKGSLFLSYVPFKGAKEIGVAEKNKMRLEIGDLKLNIQSSEYFLPPGVVGKVYGYINESQKTDRPFSVQSYGSDKEANFLRHIKK